MKTTDLRVTDTAGNHQFAIVDDSTGQDVALVYNRSEDSKETAQLLAAAPELLEALQKLIDDIEYSKEVLPMGAIGNRQINFAKAAIQKATNP